MASETVTMAIEPTRRYRLMKLTFYGDDHRVSAVLPCPNCFLASLRAGEDTVCSGCLNYYSEGANTCFYAGDQRSDEEKAQDPTPQCFCTIGRFSAGLAECKYSGDSRAYVERNSAFYTAAQVKVLWSTIDFDHATHSQRVVGLSDAHNDQKEPCLNCYGHYFPCSANCDDFSLVTLLSYDGYRRDHVAQSRMPTTYEAYVSLANHAEERMIEESWYDRAHPEGKYASDDENDE